MSKLWPPKRIARFKELWASDMPLPELAAEMGMNVEAAYARGKSLGLPKRNARRSRPRAAPEMTYDMRSVDMRPTYAAQTAELVERWIALSLRVQAERRAA
jgi:arginine/lysine/ornithine decarboxylase